MNTTAINYKDVFKLAQSKKMTSNYVDLMNNDEILFLTLIQKWLRDTHKIIVLPRFHNKISVYSYWIIKNENELPLMPINGFDTYESALMEGINEALQLI